MRSGSGLIKLVLALAFMATATMAFAQAEGGRRGRGGPGNNPLMLLRIEAVQKDLDLNDDQKTSLNKLADEQREATRDLSREERQQKGPELREKAQKQIVEILKPEQAQRLEEIGLQVAGARALTRADVAEKLGLSSEQKDKLQELMPRGGPGGGAGGPPPESPPPAEAGGGGQGGGGGGGNFGDMRARREEMNSKAMEILTSQQREQFEKMQGKKIEIDPSQFFRRGQGGNGGGGNRPAPDA